MPLNGYDPACREICEAFGLKNLRSLIMRLDATKVAVVDVIVTASFYPDVEALQKVEQILKRYKLEEIHD